MPGLDDTIRDALKAIEAVLLSVYKSGVEHGKHEAASEFKSRLATLLSDGAMEFEPVQSPASIWAETDDGSSDKDERAAPGTVKPAIIHALRSNPNGLFRREIVDMTGIKINSVRGTLWGLQKAGVVTKNDADKWVLSAPDSADSETSKRDAVNLFE